MCCSLRDFEARLLNEDILKIESQRIKVKNETRKTDKQNKRGIPVKNKYH